MGGGAISTNKTEKKNQSEKKQVAPYPAANSGLEFSEGQGSRLTNFGNGIIPQDSDHKPNKNIDKATSLLDEMSREERSGFKARISAEEMSGSKSGHGIGTGIGITDIQKSLRSNRKSDEDNYDEDFEDIEEDLPRNDDDLDVSH